MIPPFTTEQLRQVQIVGNAGGKWQPLSQGLSFIFNGTEAVSEIENLSQAQALSQIEATSVKNAASSSVIINIANGGYAQSDAAFVVQSNQLTQSQCERLTLQLDAMAQSLKCKLNCWPSSGLSCFALLSQHAPVQVSRMSLLPSLARPPQMSIDEHLPCIVHNWLGERRIALEIMTKGHAKTLMNTQASNSVQHSVNWPELCLPEQDVLAGSILVSEKLSNQNAAFALLHQLASCAPLNTRQYHASLKQLADLSQVAISHWQSSLNKQQLQAALIKAEALFIDHSLQQHPKMRHASADTLPRYWYLADNAASQYLDPIREQLALCQQALILS
ncbi:hypothetical protein [Shewanella sp.]|uniref:hypothetical protein n=1 Tax=Shewanella sp. TaxID=50422 RepID=UPI004053974A